MGFSHTRYLTVLLCVCADGTMRGGKGLNKAANVSTGEKETNSPLCMDASPSVDRSPLFASLEKLFRTHADSGGRFLCKL